MPTSRQSAPLLRLAAVLGALACLALAGCHRRTEVEVANLDKVLLFGNGAEPKELDPGRQDAAIEYTIDLATFEGLTLISGDGKRILPGAAKSWEISDDQLTYTFHLRPEGRWSNGSAVTAEDFVYAFNRVFDPAMDCENNNIGMAITGASALVAGKPGVLGVTALDPLTLRIHLDYPAPYILEVLAGAPFVPVPRQVVDRFDARHRIDTAWSRPGNLVGNGPFVLASWVANKAVVVTKNPYYWDREHIRLNGIKFFPTEDTEAEERSFRAGQLHVTYGLPSSKLAVYRQDPRLHVSPQLETWYLAMNATRPPFNDARVRRAFALAIDRDRIVPALFSTTAVPAHSLTRPGTAGFNPKPPDKDFDPVEAKALLAAAGYPDGRGFPAVALSLSPTRYTPFAEAAQESWRKILNVPVTIESEEHKVFLADVMAKKYSLASTGYFYGIDSPATILEICRSRSLYNHTGVANDDYDRLFDAANATPSDAERNADFDQLEAIIRRETALSPVFFINVPYLVSPSVHGWQENGLGTVDWRDLSLE